MSTQTPLLGPFRLKPLKFIAPLRSEKVDVVPVDGEYLGLEQFESWTGKLSGVELQQPPEGGGNRFLCGDVLFGKLRPYLAKAWVANRSGYCTSESLVLSPQGADSRYIRYCLLTNEVISAIDGSTYGSKMPRADWGFIGGVNLPFPSHAEQEHIANFLDDKTARIDALIAEKERLATSLEEYRLSAINNAVSTGLSSSPRLSETSDEWFEKIPSHWSFCPLNYRYEIQLGKMLDEKQITGNFLRPYLRNTDVQWGRINVENLPQMDISPDELSRYTVMPGDLMVCEGGDVGRAAIWDGTSGEMAYQKALHRVRPRSQKDLPKFMYYCLFDSAKRGRFSGRGQATIAHLTAEAFRRYRFAFPPLEEQQAIVLHLDGITQKLDTLMSHCEEHIARLREYRSSLISAAVTGQLDVGAFKEAH